MTQATIDIDLHPAQWEVFHDSKRFVMCVAGRRFGKSWLAVRKCCVEAAKMTNEHGYDLRDKEVFYIAPTFDQAKRIAWRMFKAVLGPLLRQAYENTGVLELVNGRVIELKGADRPDTLRGVGLSYAVIDEYADQKPFVWEEVVQPALQDVEGGALFIGTPKGKNHFYDLWVNTHSDPEWGHHEFTTLDNPYINPKEVEARKRTMSTHAYMQELQAKFISAGSGDLRMEWFRESEQEPEGGMWVVSVDLAGFQDGQSGTKGILKRLDDSAIVVAKVHQGGWWVKTIIHGKWNTRETAHKIIEACRLHGARTVGIEDGALKNAVDPYLREEMVAQATFPRVLPTKHGGKKKSDRILWCLQGRLEQGFITFCPGEYLRKLKEEAADFPNTTAHDDCLDALAYLDQIAPRMANMGIRQRKWNPLDLIAGY